VPSVYIHLSGSDSDSIVDAMRGTITTQKLENTLTPKNCNYCAASNKGTNDFCEKCGATLTLNGIIQKEENHNKFEQELMAKQNLIEQYLEYQKEKIKQLEEKIIKS
jgi:hypothetical protein